MLWRSAAWCLYRSFWFRLSQLDEPWDSPHNLALLPRMPDVFRAPIGRFPPRGLTYYQVLVGEGAAFEGTEGLQLDGDFPDGAENTLLIVVAAEPVPWTKPADVTFTEGDPRTHLLFKSIRLPAAFADCSTRGIRPSVSVETLRALITRNGGEAVDWDSVE